MSAPGLDVNVLRAEVAMLRRVVAQENGRGNILTRVISVLAKKAGGTIVVDGLEFDTIGSRQISIQRPGRTEQQAAPDVTLTLLPAQGEGTKTGDDASGATATDASEAPAAAEPERPRLRIVEP